MTNLQILKALENILKVRDLDGLNVAERYNMMSMALSTLIVILEEEENLE